MWKQEKNDSIVLHLALSLALATTPLAANVLVSLPVLAESTTDVSTFPLPQTVENATRVRIDGSMSLVMINQSLKDSFEKQFSGTEVEIRVNGTDAALKALLDGEIDIAAIARGLTPAEKAQGLEQISLYREKIAIIVGANNPFQGGLTIEQLAKIFRGEITDWSELGGAPGKIRLIDRPLNGDIRNSFRNYPVFKSAEFGTGANAIQIAEDKTALIVKELGTDGISYARDNQVSKLPDVRTLKIQGFTANESKYPFSQPLVYVYKQNPSPAVASFLGFTTASVGKKAIATARDAEASAIAASALQSFTLETATNSTPAAQSVDTVDTVDTTVSFENPNVVNSLRTESLPTTNNSSNQQFVNPLANRNAEFLIVFSLLPIVGLGGFVAWWLKRKQQSAEKKISLLETSNGGASITETILTIPDEYSTTSPVNHTTLTNGTSQSHQNTNSIISKPENNSTVTESTTLTGTLNIVTAKSTNTRTKVTNPFTDKTIALDSGEVVWDTEAPVAVVNTPYPAVTNIPAVSFNNLEFSTDELSSSLLELLEEPAASSAKEASVSLTEALGITANSPVENSTISLSQLLDDITESSAKEASVSLTEALGITANSPVENSTISLSELLDDITESSAKEASVSLTEALGITANSPVENSTISLSELLDDITESSAKEASVSLTEALGITANSEDADSHTSLWELFSVTANSEDADSHTSLWELLPVSTTNSDPESRTSLTSLSELLGLKPEAEGSDLSPITDEIKKSLSDLSNELEEVFNTFENQAEIKADLAAETINHQVWEIEADTENIASADNLLEDYLSDSKAQTHTTEIVSWSDISGDSSIVFTPRTPQWAYVSWYVAETQKEAAQKIGGTILAVRLYDATDIDLSYQFPQLVQQYECEEVICDCYVAIPTSNRDYMTEIGYVTNNNDWLCIARSGKIRIFSRPGKDFWFVADTELVIHGSTEPGATVTIDGHKIKLHSDGTFHLRVPFSDKLFNYLMKATTDDGEQSITILKKFFQESSESS
ncbi:substrate-binding domain-containing protein [Sphaerospermopsis sp. FACHB-1194]|uniref:substrate-binding domain-containing protein n=1 Tax=Sphaerospermopsis sp. FACHB-1194 TaxID=2692862 RepID=UPI001681BA40|nr:substrate-binding domain-containing protein [Sphaerospermopsis sp. FACHB-1194]MBD2145297.1 substrate-binding domain-containing protein [Sphaerospermopsis sp. FACHB-1194]